MEGVASDCIRVVWEGFDDGAVFEADSSFLNMAGSSWEVATKTRDASKV